MEEFNQVWDRLFAPVCFERWLMEPLEKCKECPWQQRCIYKIKEKIIYNGQDESEKKP